MYKTICHFSTYIVPTLCRETLLSLDKSRELYSRKMKLLAVVFFAGLLSISAAAVSDNLFGLSLQPSAQAVSSSLPYSRHKRQVEDFDQLRRCQGIIYDQQCSNGQAQETANLGLRCNLTSLAIQAQNVCRRNADGLYCGLAIHYIYEVDSIEEICATAITSSCTTQCRDLLMFIRNELGCCVNLIFNSTTNSLLFMPEVFNNSLWTTCGVAPVTETCSSSPISSSPISLNTTIDIDPNCDMIAEKGIELTCTKRFLDPVVDALEDAGDCQAYVGAVMEGCGVNEEGERCITQLAIFSQLSQAQVACSLTDTTCTEVCTQALEDFSDVGGCCVNNLFNGSLAGIAVPRYDILSFEFWSNCGVDTLGTCEVRLNAATTLHAGTALLMLSVLLCMLFYY